MVLNVCCADCVRLATDCPSIISTTLGAGVPPTALHVIVRSWPSVPNNLLFTGVALSMLKLDGATVKKTNYLNINKHSLFHLIILGYCPSMLIISVYTSLYSTVDNIIIMYITWKPKSKITDDTNERWWGTKERITFPGVRIGLAWDRKKSITFVVSSAFLFRLCNRFACIFLQWIEFQ